MGIPAINSLANMEYMLYGGLSGGNSKCPSFANGYSTADLSQLNPYAQFGNPYFNYGSFAPAFSGLTGQPNSIYAGYNNQALQNNTQVQPNATFGASQADIDTLANYYGKKMEPSESFMGAAVGGATFGLLNNLRLVRHPYDSFKAYRATEKLFQKAGIKDTSSELYKLFTNEETTKIVQDAYGAEHKLLVKSQKGLFSREAKEISGLCKRLSVELKNALKSGNKEEIAKVTEKIRFVTKQKAGWLVNTWRHLMTPLRNYANGREAGLLTSALKKIAGNNPVKNGEIKAMLDSHVNSKEFTEAWTKRLEEKTIKGTSFKGKFLENFKKGGGVKGGLLFLGFEFLTSLGNIKSAFSKDNSTGIKQLGQTAVKGAGSAIGWVAGEAAGAAVGAKLGAAAGTAICPGIGTAIGAVAGLIGGSIGCWLMGKVTHKILGQDAGTLAKVEKMKQTKQGQVELLQLTAQQAQDDKKIDQRTLQAIQNIATFYGADKES